MSDKSQTEIFHTEGTPLLGAGVTPSPGEISALHANDIPLATVEKTPQQAAEEYAERNWRTDFFIAILTALFIAGGYLFIFILVNQKLNLSPFLAIVPAAISTLLSLAILIKLFFQEFFAGKWSQVKKEWRIAAGISIAFGSIVALAGVYLPAIPALNLFFTTPVGASILSVGDLFVIAGVALAVITIIGHVAHIFSQPEPKTSFEIVIPETPPTGISLAIQLSANCLLHPADAKILEQFREIPTPDKLDTIFNDLKDSIKNVNFKDPKSGYTPLHYACLYGHKKLIEFLVAQGADKNASCFNLENDWDNGPKPEHLLEIMYRDKGQEELYGELMQALNGVRSPAIKTRDSDSPDNEGVNNFDSPPSLPAALPSGIGATTRRYGKEWAAPPSAFAPASGAAPHS